MRALARHALSPEATKAGRWRCRATRSSLKRCTARIGRVRSYSMDDLFRELEEEHRASLGEDLIEDMQEKPEETQPMRRRYDYADRQEIWPTAEDDSGYVQIGPLNLGPDPTKGPLERQVSMGYREAMLTDKVDPEHMKYWFTTPPGGWNTKPRLVKKAEELPGFFASSRNNRKESKNIAHLEPGTIFNGTVVEVWYDHGTKVDIGYDYDGLLPMRKEKWREFQNRLDLGDEVEVVVEKVWNKDFYRWPIQLKACDPEIQAYLIPAEEWDPPIDMRGKTVEEIERHTSRRLPTDKWFIHDDPDREANPYHDSANLEGRPPALPFSDEEWEEIQEDYFDDMLDAASDLRDYRF